MRRFVTLTRSWRLGSIAVAGGAVVAACGQQRVEAPRTAPSSGTGVEVPSAKAAASSDPTPLSTCVRSPATSGAELVAQLGLGVTARDGRSAEDVAWFETERIFRELRALADPRAGDALAVYLAGKHHHHFETTAAFALAEIGDLRAVPALARRLRMDPLKVHRDDIERESAHRRDDNERVVAARLIAELAVLRPEATAQIRERAEAAVIGWIHELPSPHASGLRALAAMGSTKDLPTIRKWANPTVPLPTKGAQPPMPEEWVIAQVALRYVGWIRDEPSWPVTPAISPAEPMRERRASCVPAPRPHPDVARDDGRRIRRPGFERRQLVNGAQV